MVLRAERSNMLGGWRRQWWRDLLFVKEGGDVGVGNWAD
jgi:hypothetical protein